MIDMNLAESDCVQVEVQEQYGKCVMYVHVNGMTQMRVVIPAPIEIINDIAGVSMTCTPET